MNEIEELLRQTMGLDSNTLGPTLVENAIHARMRANNLLKTADYLKLLQASSTEWNALIESVVITETWFFRGREPFRALVGFVQREWLPTHHTGKLRILSLPCSTGEEPYSIAMALQESGLANARFEIDAMDINQAAIGRALRAEYGKNSFRGKDLGFRTRYFQPSGNGYTLNPSARESVRFHTKNILADSFTEHASLYDFIFCRNLLIYFDRPTQERVLHKLNSWLTTKGLLFVGPAEVPIALQNGFVSAKAPLSFACRKVAVENDPHPVSARLSQSITTESLTPIELSPIQRPVSAEALHTQQPDLAKARQLVNDGCMKEAVAICETYLREQGASAEAYYLLGLTRDIAGAESQASEFYRKALYLEPNHYETLMQWASLSEKTGDGAHARILNERAERIRNHN